MSTLTTKRQWYKPALTDAPPNIETATQFLDQLDDVGLIFYGTFAARPAATASNGHTAGCPGTEYYATDTNQLFKSVAGTWRQIPIIGSSLAQIGTADLANNAVTAAKIEAQQAWQTISFTGITGGNVSYMKDSLGFVHFQRQALACGVQTGGATIATMPAGYRPGASLRFPAIWADFSLDAQPQVLQITSAGVVSFPVGGAANANGLVFIVDYRAEN